MVKLEAGNVLLKPSHRRQLMGWLRRPQKIGQRLGNFDLTITFNRIGHAHEIRAAVHDAAGDFSCRARQRDWRSAMRLLVHQINSRLHEQHLAQMA